MPSHTMKEREKKRRKKIEDRTSFISKFFGGLSGRARDALKQRRGQIDEAVEGRKKRKR